jgi:NAD(P)-dependent dehydrogenase (short-subunit alcohol dehydrogenase family)
MNSQVILVTGASSGFGRATAETLADHGHTVYATVRDMTGKNEPVVRELQHVAQVGKTCLHVLQLDVTKTDSIERAMQTIVNETGHLDVLVNNAGVAYAGITEGFTPEQATAQFDVNVIGILRTMRSALPHFRRQGHGLIINIGSILGRVTFPFFGLYGATKYALEALTESYRNELSQLGIDVALIQPSAYPTAMYANMQGPADAARLAEYGEVAKIPGAMMESFGKMLSEVDAPKPQEIADAISHLIAQPAGTRAFRTVVGTDFGAKTVNAQTAPVQAGVLERLGLGHLDTLKVSQRLKDNQKEDASCL